MPMTRVAAGHPGHRRGQVAAAAGDVVEVHRLADHQVAVGVEAAPELGAVVLEVALDLELLPQAERVALRGPVDEVAAEAVGEHVVAAERDLGDHPGDRQAVLGPSPGAAS